MDCFEIICPDCGAIFTEPMYRPPDDVDGWLVQATCLFCHSLLAVWTYWCEYGCLEGIVTSVQTSKTSLAMPATDPFPYPVRPEVN